jgi:hypothetical protein
VASLFISASIGGIFLKIYTSYSSRVCYNHSKCGCDQSVIKDTFLSLFSPVFNVRILNSLFGMYISVLHVIFLYVYVVRNLAIPRLVGVLHGSTEAAAVRTFRQ